MPITDINTAKTLAQDLSIVYAGDVAGEPFHEEYKKNKETFRLLVKSELKTKRLFKAYFKNLSVRIMDYIDWVKYQNKVLSAGEIDNWIDLDWDGETVDVRVNLTQGLVDALRAGAQSAEDEFNIPTDWTPTSTAFNDYLRDYVVSLSGDLVDTTIDRITSAIKTSLSNHETVAEATKRISDVIDDPKRAEMIARTESIRAFAAGREEAGAIMGASHKEWYATYKACPICGAMDGQQVKINEEFKYQDLRFLRPPGHPNCRCYIRLIFKD